MTLKYQELLDQQHKFWQDNDKEIEGSLNDGRIRVDAIEREYVSDFTPIILAGEHRRFIYSKKKRKHYVRYTVTEFGHRHNFSPVKEYMKKVNQKLDADKLNQYKIPIAEGIHMKRHIREKLLKNLRDTDKKLAELRDRQRKK